MNEFLEKVKKKGDLLGLISVRGLFSQLGNPQNALNCIQVVGTNGKGSTCAFLSSILKEAGFRVGVYTSPEVFSYFERFSVNGKNITEEEFEEVLETVKVAYEVLEDTGKPLPTIFEVETACAVLFFCRQNCDFIIMEAGMGGDLDATNVFDNPLMAIFAPIGIDHVDFLGKTVEEITAHKAGIIKKCELVVSATQSQAVKTVLDKVCSEMETAAVYSDKEDIGNISIGLPGGYQKINAAAAMCAAKQLRTAGYAISDKAIKLGLENAAWPGRFERILMGDKEIRLDGAHNVPAALALKSAIEAEYPGEKVDFVLGMLADKDIEGVLSVLKPLANSLYTVTPDNPRALSADKLAKRAEKVGISNVLSCENIEIAVNIALKNSGKVVVFAGTFTILGEIKSILEKK